jgi:hypothetical protein
MPDPTAPLFCVPNRQAADCGPPPELPADFADGPYFRSYFQNRFGEQWLAYRRLPDGDLVVRSGDVGWQTPLAIRRATLRDLFDALDGQPSTLAQILLAGKVLCPEPLPEAFNRIRSGAGQIVLPVTIVSEAGDPVTDSWMVLGLEEQAWIDACVAGSGYEPRVLTAEEVKAEILAMLAAADEEE